MKLLRWGLVVALLSLVVLAPSGAHADKPEKIPVAMGKWKGPHAAGFKSALRRGLAKYCTIGSAKKARAIIDGEETEEGKKAKLTVIVRAAKTKEVVEQREYNFSKPSASAGQASKMGREVAEMAGRAPTE